MFTATAYSEKLIYHILAEIPIAPLSLCCGMMSLAAANDCWLKASFSDFRVQGTHTMWESCMHPEIEKKAVISDSLLLVMTSSPLCRQNNRFLTIYCSSAISCIYFCIFIWHAHEIPVCSRVLSSRQLYSHILFNWGLNACLVVSCLALVRRDERQKVTSPGLVPEKAGLPLLNARIGKCSSGN